MKRSYCLFGDFIMDLKLHTISYKHRLLHPHSTLQLERCLEYI